MTKLSQFNPNMHAYIFSTKVLIVNTFSSKTGRTAFLKFYNLTAPILLFTYYVCRKNSVSKTRQQ